MKEVDELLQELSQPRRRALSAKFPGLKKPIIFARRSLRSFSNLSNPKIRYSLSLDFFPRVVARHQSVLRRKLGDSDSRLQEQKIVNLKQAVSKLNGIIIAPGDIFSFWDIIGRPTYKNGYVDGMLLSGGKVVEGPGGGLCQLSNFLYWIFLHSPVKVVERYHHSLDVFPDSGRVLPFGGGATVLYNFVDLKLQNISPKPLQLKLWLTDTHLKGQILCPEPIEEKYHLVEKNHHFVHYNNKYYRYNEIWQEIKLAGRLISSYKINTNFAPVLYKVTPDYLRRNNFKLIKKTS